MRSMIAANVDDFPDPVGPVTNTIPFRNLAICCNSAGKFSSSKPGTLLGMTLITMTQLLRCINTFTRKRDEPGKL